MSDEVEIGYSGEGEEAGQPLDQAQDSQPNYVTRDELLGQLNALREDVRRFSQSITDKATSRLGEAIKKQEKDLLDRVQLARAQGVDIADDFVAEERKRILRAVLAGDGEEDEEQQAHAAPPDYRTQAKVLAAQARVAEAMAGAGFDIEQNDPELRTIKRNGTVEEWERTILAALQQKAARLGRPMQARGETEPSAPPAAVRVPAGGSGAGVSPQTLDAKTAELRKLQAKSGKTSAEWQRMSALEEEILSQLK